MRPQEDTEIILATAFPSVPVEMLTPFQPECKGEKGEDNIQSIIQMIALRHRASVDTAVLYPHMLTALQKSLYQPISDSQSVLSMNWLKTHEKKSCKTAV